ncbi:MAG: Fic family protein [Rhizobiales bacterium]|nr:Fic family protein [Hyphomicrobiales bacterium]
MAKDRSSEAQSPLLITDRRAIAEREAENSLKQFDASMAELQKWLKNNSYRLKPSLLLKLNRSALEGISEYAGNYRPAGVKITGSSHTPVEASEVPSAVEEMCEYVNDNWQRQTAVHLCAYVLWRLNWIHPFVDGNGRTARAVSYLVLCAKLGARLPGKNTIPEQIAANKSPYYRALESADGHYKNGGRIDVSAMESMLDSQLAQQLVDVHVIATGGHQKSNTDVASQDTKQLSIWQNVVQTVEKHPVISTGIITIAAAMIAVLFAT